MTTDQLNAPTPKTYDDWLEYGNHFAAAGEMVAAANAFSMAARKAPDLETAAAARIEAAALAGAAAAASLHS